MMRRGVEACVIGLLLLASLGSRAAAPVHEGEELLGTPAPAWTVAAWINSRPLTLEQLKGKVDVPAILFYPGELDGAAGLRFMGVLDAEHSYRPKIF